MMLDCLAGHLTAAVPIVATSAWVALTAQISLVVLVLALGLAFLRLVLSGGAVARVNGSKLTELVITDTIRPTGSLSFDYGDESYLDDWIAGTSRALVFTISGAANGIETSFAYSCTVTFAAVKFTGSDLNMSLTDKTEQPLTWQAFDNGSDPLWQIVYRTTDTAI